MQINGLDFTEIKQKAKPLAISYILIKREDVSLLAIHSVSVFIAEEKAREEGEMKPE